MTFKEVTAPRDIKGTLETSWRWGKGSGSGEEGRWGNWDEWREGTLQSGYIVGRKNN